MTRRTIPTLRTFLYRSARQLGDADAIIHPSKAPRRLANKWLGRNLVKRIWR